MKLAIPEGPECLMSQEDIWQRWLSPCVLIRHSLTSKCLAKSLRRLLPTQKNLEGEAGSTRKSSLQIAATACVEWGKGTGWNTLSFGPEVQSKCGRPQGTERGFVSRSSGKITRRKHLENTFQAKNRLESTSFFLAFFPPKSSPPEAICSQGGCKKDFLDLISLSLSFAICEVS